MNKAKRRYRSRRNRDARWRARADSQGYYEVTSRRRFEMVMPDTESYGAFMMMFPILVASKAQGELLAYIEGREHCKDRPWPSSVKTGCVALPLWYVEECLSKDR